MQDQLKNNFLSISLQGQQQKNIGGGGEKKNTVLHPQKTKQTKKAPQRNPN